MADTCEKKKMNEVRSIWAHFSFTSRETITISKTANLFNRVVRSFSFRYRDVARRWEWPQIVKDELFGTITPRRYEIDVFLRDFHCDYCRNIIDMRKEWWSLVPFSFELGKYFHRYGVRSFVSNIL